jgi:hypothetical protein
VSQFTAKNMRTSQKLSFLVVAFLLPCFFASAKRGDVKNASRPISGVTSTFQLLNTVIRSGEPINIRVTLHNESASPVEFRYVTGSFIEHIRIYDARHHQVPARLNAPFLESGAEKVILQPGEQFMNVVTADLWQMYDLEPGTYEVRFYYDLRLIADETLAAMSMKRYHSKDWILWDMKRYPLTVVGAEASDAQARLGSSINDFLSLWGSPIREEVLDRTARIVWDPPAKNNEELSKAIFEAEVSFLDRIACEIVLRSKHPLKKARVVKLAKELVRDFPTSDLTTLKSENDGGITYTLSSGGYIAAWPTVKPGVVVIRSTLFLENNELFAQEAAKVRPPTSSH